jgi:hypothetical protein
MTISLLKRNALAKLQPAVINENRAEIFFDNGSFLGEWNPTLNPNQLPANKQANGVFLVNANSEFKNIPLSNGQFVKYTGDNSPLMRYQQFIPKSFLASFISEIQEQSDNGGTNNTDFLLTYTQAKQ